MKRCSLLFAIGLVTVWGSAPSEANADDDPPDLLFGQPVNRPPRPSAEEYEARRKAFRDHLRVNDLELAGDVLVPRQRLANPEGDGPVQDHDGTWHDPPHYHTIFLNFFGGMLTSGTNAAEAQSGCVGGVPIDYPGYSGSEGDALAIIQVFENAMEDYAVRVSYEEIPPKHLPYSMVMMGGSPQDIGLGQGVLGVSCSSDCGDTWWHDTTFAFTEASNNVGTLGNTALQEAAHAFGLDHIDGQENIMYPFASSGTKVWAQECTAYNDATGGISCTYIHGLFCPEGSQSDDAELLAFFGPNAPDMEPPVVTIMQPADGVELEPGDDVTIQAEVGDDHEGFGWQLRVMPPTGEAQLAQAYQGETSWTLSGLTEGVWTVRVEAIDHDLNEGSDEVTILVGDVEAPATTGDGDTGVDESSTGEGEPVPSSGTDGDSDGSGGDTSMATDDAGDGCGCISGGGGSAWALLALLGWVRRRRR